MKSLFAIFSLAGLLWSQEGLAVSIDGYSFSPPRIIHCETDDECRNVNCTGNITSQGNLTVTFSHAGSCSEPAQINVTTFDTVELDSGGIATVTQSIRVTDCFWIPQNKRSGSISQSSPSWNGGTYLEFYVHSRTSASGVVNIEFGIVNGSYGEFSNIEPSSDPHCRKPVKEPNNGALQQSVTGLLVIFLILALV